MRFSLKVSVTDGIETLQKNNLLISANPAVAISTMLDYTFLELCNFFTFHNSSVFISECLVHEPVDQRIRSSGYEQQVIVHQMGPSWQCNVTNIQSPDDADGNPQKAIYSDDRKHHFSSVYLVHSACETVFIWPVKCLGS